MDLKIHAFIFNWKGQLEKTLKTETDLKKVLNKVTVINSDDDNKFNHWVNIGEDAYFSAQFLKALDLFDGDIFFHVQGDVTYDNWSAIINDAKIYYEKYNYGIYAPNVDYTHWDSKRVDLSFLPLSHDKKLKLVTMTDCSCWFINKKIINEYKLNYSSAFGENKYGFGADLVSCAISIKNKMPVIRDYNYTVDHPKSTNYSSDDALLMLEKYIKTIKNKKIKSLVKQIRDCNFFKIKEYLNLNIKYSEIINDYAGDHYNGWNYVIDKLKSDINLDVDGVILDTFADNCLWEKEKPYIQKPWIGIVHTCEINPADKNKTCIQAFINNDWFIKSSPFCVALITLSSYHAKILQKKVNVPVFNTIHPKETDRKFNINSYFENPSIMHSGFFNRNYSNFAKFKTSIQKIININKEWYIQSMNDCFTLNDVNNDDINSLCINNIFLNNEDYIENLCKKIGFCYFYDTAANNSILEHIMSHTPIIVNKLPATIEYLGEDYPMFYEKIKDNPDQYLLSKDFVKKTSEYLKNRSNNKIFKINYFINFIKNLSVPIKDIPIYCINLKRAEERKKIILDEWTNKRGININFFNAFDRQNADIHNLPEPYNKNILNKKTSEDEDNFLLHYLGNDKKMTIGEICCSISHCNLLKKLIDEDIEEAIILEDDAIPLFNSSEDFFKAIELCKKENKNLDILLLHKPISISDGGFELDILETKENYSILNKFTTCTQAIYYSKKGMKKCYESASRLIAPIDLSWQFKIVGEKSLNIINKPLVEHTNLTTYINEDNPNRIFISNQNKVKISKLKRMRIYSACSESHEVFKPWFESIYNIYPEIDIKYISLDQSCQSGEFQSHGWNDVTLSKLKKILEIFDDDSNNDDYFIFSDIDVQFFNTFDNIIINLLQDNDIIFQNDYSAGLCTGFFCCRKTDLMKSFFKKAIDLFNRDDQVTVQNTLKEFPVIKYKLLPQEFFTYGMFNNSEWNLSQNNRITDFKIPSNITMHHANWTVGINNKIKLLNFVKDNYKNQRFL